MNRKRNKSRQFKVVKCFTTILICILTFPCNYSGNPSTLNFTACNPDFPNTKCPINTGPYHTKTNIDITNSSKDDEIPDEPIVSDNVLITSISILILSTILTLLILGYFYSVPTVKQSLVVFLHQDICKLALLYNCSHSIAIITCYAIGNGHTIPPTPAKAISYCIISLNLHLLLAINAHGFLNLYSNKEMVLDPHLPWVENDRFAIKMMRLFSLVIVSSVTSVLFAYEQYPKLYYLMIGDNTPISELPIGATVVLVLLIVLIVTYVITSVAAVFYEQRSIFFGDNTAIPSGLRYLLYLPLFLSGFSQIYSVLFNFVGDGEIWIILIVFQIGIGVILPIIIILTSSQLKNYVKGTFQPSISFVSVFYERYASRRSPQVYPLEE